MSKDDIFQQLKEILSGDFEIDPALITPDAKLYEELDIDSIDAVDMLVKMKERIPGKIDPAVFKTARTVQDIVELLHSLVQG
jgi:acyl carrier protein